MSTHKSNKHHIGILLPQARDGGYFQLSIGVADSLLKYGERNEYSILVYDEEMLDWLTGLDRGASIVYIERRKTRHRINTFLNMFFGLQKLPTSVGKQSSRLREAKLDLLVVPFPGLFGFMEEIPYITVIADIMYKKYPGHQYVSLRNRIQAMIVHRYAAKYSSVTVVDSPQGVDDLNKYFEIPKDRIRVVPHIPPGYIFDNHDMNAGSASAVLSKHELPERFLLYPSQFCYDKNHTRLIQALHLVKQRYNIRIPLVLAGGRGESFDDIMLLIDKSGMSDQVIYLGFVSGKEIVALYKKAVALTYVSICGPTNIPPLEAMLLGTPLLCSNLYSMPEQVGDAALLFDPFDIEDIADKIYTIWIDEDLRRKLVRKGYEQIRDLTQERYAKQWEAVIEDALGQVR